MDYELNMSNKDYVKASLSQIREFRDKFTNLIEIMERMLEIYDYIDELKTQLVNDPGLIFMPPADNERLLKILKEAENLDSDFSSVVIDIQKQAKAIALLSKLKVNEKEVT